MPVNCLYLMENKYKKSTITKKLKSNLLSTSTFSKTPRTALFERYLTTSDAVENVMTKIGVDVIANSNLLAADICGGHNDMIASKIAFFSIVLPMIVIINLMLQIIFLV